MIKVKKHFVNLYLARAKESCNGAHTQEKNTSSRSRTNDSQFWLQQNQFILQVQFVDNFTLLSLWLLRILQGMQFPLLTRSFDTFLKEYNCITPTKIFGVIYFNYRNFANTQQPWYKCFYFFEVQGYRFVGIKCLALKMKLKPQKNLFGLLRSLVLLQQGLL